MVQLTMPGRRFRLSDSSTRYGLEAQYLNAETPRLYGQAAQCLAEAAHCWGIIAENNGLNQGKRDQEATAAWDKAAEGIAHITMARQCNRYLREHTDEVHVPEGMRVYPRALFQKMLVSMAFRNSRIAVPTQQDAATLRGMARNLAEQAHAVALLLARGRAAVQPLPPAE